MSPIAQIMEPEVEAAEQGFVKENGVAVQALAHDVHSIPTEEQITRVLFLIIMAASVLFIGATLFVVHM